MMTMIRHFIPGFLHNVHQLRVGFTLHEIVHVMLKEKQANHILQFLSFIQSVNVQLFRMSTTSEAKSSE